MVGTEDADHAAEAVSELHVNGTENVSVLLCYLPGFVGCTSFQPNSTEDTIYSTCIATFQGCLEVCSLLWPKIVKGVQLYFQ